jgi:hypothetical protein
MAENNIPPLAPASEVLRDHFLGWQCRIRQYAVRHAGGRPTAGMRPRALDMAGATRAPALTLLILPREPFASTEAFRHIAKRTHDPRERYEKAMELLAAAHYQHPRAFSDVMTGLFSASAATAASSVPAALLAAGTCVLAFEQFSQRYRVPSTVAALPPEDPAHRATYWHNALFNPNIPAEIQILAFTPDWANASADPPAR